VWYGSPAWDPEQEIEVVHLHDLDITREKLSQVFISELAIPTGQVFKWPTSRIMIQPSTTSACGGNAPLPAPSKVAISQVSFLFGAWPSVWSVYSTSGRLFLTNCLVCSDNSKLPREGLHVESNWAEKHPCLQIAPEIKITSCPWAFAIQRGTVPTPAWEKPILHLMSCFFEFCIFQSQRWAELSLHRINIVMWRWGKINPTPGWNDVTYLPIQSSTFVTR